jgi:two-component system, LuxR family, sensor kinase FixL
MSAGMKPTPAEQVPAKGLLETLLDVSGLLVVVLDEEGRIQRFSRACEVLSGFSERELLGKTIWSTLIPEDELSDVRQVHGRLRDRYEAENIFVNHWLTRSGEKRLIQWCNASLRDEAGNTLGYVGTGIDVSERERALNAQWHWEHERHYLLDSLPLLIAHIDPDFRIRFANDGYRQWFGLEPEKLLGEHLLSVIGEAAFETLLPHFKDALAGERSIYHGKIAYLHGPTRFIHGTYIPNREEDGQIDGFYIVTVDLTDQQRLREERDRARREARSHLLELAHSTRLSAMSEIATGLAHEISQPLTAIAASAEASLMRLENHPEATDSLKPALEKIAAQGQRARRIIEQLRNFLRKDLEDSREDHALADLVGHILLLLESELDNARVEVETDIDPAIGAIRVNRVQIEQVLFNLVRNAVDALEDVDGERRILIRCRGVPERNECRVEVSDSGPGISESDMPRLFHPFYTTKQKGLGQGLSICRSILDRHGGTIQAENQAGGGAMFSFTLPLGETVA